MVHSQYRAEAVAPWPRELFGAPIEGLRPLVSEPVYFRRGLSAFANPGFTAELRGARGADVYLIGFSLADTCLATALAGVDEGLSLTLVEDAVGATRNWPRPMSRAPSSNPSFNSLQAAGWSRRWRSVVTDAERRKSPSPYVGETLEALPATLTC